MTGFLFSHRDGFRDPQPMELRAIEPPHVDVETADGTVRFERDRGWTSEHDGPHYREALPTTGARP